jgi:hypothetical protein
MLHRPAEWSATPSSCVSAGAGRQTVRQGPVSAGLTGNEQILVQAEEIAAFSSSVLDIGDPPIHLGGQEVACTADVVGYNL